MIRRRMPAIATFAIVLLASSALRASTPGCQAIGLANWTPTDVQRLAQDVIASGDAEVTFLPFEFAPPPQRDPFANATALAQTVLQDARARLRVTGYLYFHDYGQMKDTPFVWSAFRSGRLNAKEQAFRNLYLDRVARFDRWTMSLRSWAAQRGVSSRLTIVLCPFLEDDCRSTADYANLLGVIAQQQRADGASTPIRRCCQGNNVFRVNGLPLEAHGDIDRVAPTLTQGDVFSNDGSTVHIDDSSLNRFIVSQRRALSRGVSVLLQRGAYNGLDRYPNAPPSQRLNLSPLTGRNSAEDVALRKVLGAR